METKGKSFIDSFPISKFKDLNHLVEYLKSTDRQDFECNFFHPFYFIMMNKYKLFNTNHNFFDKSENSVISIFQINRNKMTVTELFTYLYSIIDEFCGLLIYLFDNKAYLTTKINISNCIEERRCENDENIKISNENQNHNIFTNKVAEMSNLFNNTSTTSNHLQKEFYNFLCYTKLEEITENKGKKKVKFSFELFFIEEKTISNSSCDSNHSSNNLNLNSLFKGSANFQTPKVLLPIMPKF